MFCRAQPVFKGSSHCTAALQHTKCYQLSLGFENFSSPSCGSASSFWATLGATHSYLSWRDKNWEMGDKKDKDDPGAAGTGYQKKEKPPRLVAGQTGSRANGQAGKPNSTRRGPRPFSAPPGSVNQSLLRAESFLSEVLLATKARRRHSRSNLFRLTLEGDPHNGQDLLFTCPPPTYCRKRNNIFEC